ncbi:hypothetical protein CHL67_00735 [Prosthecochloris sp. GSB1]|uniref:MarC family protein n=1 Tax=Prosthecochloris sp. GSB1 TaxID=281093 RepID=UPI000B8CD919|nr:MarC family protein [Prosthecochloris sp. GSB1]ASQ89639.1 hypothetical protein CHL67_00735 [Prosthecochloris sp. GSB1]
MHDLLNHTLVMIGGYFAIMNPLANAAIFTAMTAGMEEREVKKTALQAVITALCIVLCFIVLGRLIFGFFGITLPALRIAGGIMVFFIGFDMMHGKQSGAHSPAEGSGPGEGRESVAISPLGIPVLAGPGTIAVSMSYSATGSTAEIAINAFVFTCMCALTYLFFLLGERIEGKLGRDGLKVVTQLMGLILAVIGIQMGIEGVAGALELLPQGFRG